MRRDDDLTHYEKCLVELYESDPGVAYDLNQDELQTLMGLVGEEDPVIDAILKNSGASKLERAEQLGCRESDFDYEDDLPDEATQREQWRSLWAKNPEGGDKW